MERDMEVNLIFEALKFMVLGMGIVFTFLTTLIFVLKAQARLLTKFFPAREKVINNKVHTSTQAAQSSKKVAAIIAAVQHHENIKGK